MKTLEIKRIENIYNPEFRQMIFAYWQELMPKAAILKTEELREAYFKSDFASGDIYGAWNENRLVGYIHLKVRGDVGGIEGIYVIPEVRRRSYGSVLMRWAFDQFDQLGISQIDLYVRRDNPNAKLFCGSLGLGVAGYRMRMYRENGNVLPGVLSSDFPD